MPSSAVIFPRLFLPIVALCLALPSMVEAHPLPDIPVTTKFGADGGCFIHAVVDPRCFATDPNTEPYLLNKDLEALDAKAKEALMDKVRKFLATIVTFHFIPSGEFKPEFELFFRSLEDKPLAMPEDPVMVVGECKTRVPAGANDYQIKITPKGTFAVLFFNYLQGVKLERFQVLFPGEESYKLDLHQPIPRATAPGNGDKSIGKVQELSLFSATLIAGAALLTVVAIRFVRRRQ